MLHVLENSLKKSQNISSKSILFDFIDEVFCGKNFMEEQFNKF